MKSVIAGVIAAAALAGAAQAAETNACVWTGHDWACGDGQIVTQHFSEAAGPNIPIMPYATIDQARTTRMADPSRPR